MQENIAYEMALLLKENRELKEAIKRLEESVNYWRDEHDRLMTKIEKPKKERTPKPHLCEIPEDLKAGDKIALYDVPEGSVYADGFVFEVTKIASTRMAVYAEYIFDTLCGPVRRNSTLRVIQHKFKKVPKDTEVSHIVAVSYGENYLSHLYKE